MEYEYADGDERLLFFFYPTCSVDSGCCGCLGKNGRWYIVSTHSTIHAKIPKYPHRHAAAAAMARACPLFFR